MSTLCELVQEHGTVLSDGAIGTVLQELGLEPGATGETWNVERADDIERLHRAYADAGALVITTNTFGASRPRLALHGAEDRVAELNREGARIARRVADASGGIVAGDIGPSGELLEPLGALSADDAVAVFREQIEALLEGGADFVLIETMSDLGEVEAVVRAARAVDADVEVAATLSFDTNLHTMMGVSPAHAVRRLAELGLVAAGANCGRGPDEVEQVMGGMRDARPEGMLLIAQSNAGLPHAVGDRFCYDVTPDGMADYARRMRDLGVEIIGGCCGSTPAHVAAMAHALGTPALR